MTHKPKGIVDHKYNLTKGQKGVADGLLRGENRLDVYPRFYHVSDTMKKPGNEYMIQNKVTNIIALPKVRAYMTEMTEKVNKKVVANLVWDKEDAFKQLREIVDESKKNLYTIVYNEDGSEKKRVYSPNSASVAIKALDSITKLLGLDAPTKTDLAIEVKMGADVEKFSE